MDEGTAKQHEQVAELTQAISWLCEKVIALGIGAEALCALANGATEPVSALWTAEQRDEAIRQFGEGGFSHRIFRDEFIAEARQVWAARRP